LAVTPETLARVLETQTEWEASEGSRLPCLELLPVEADAGLRLQRVLDIAAQRARQRVDKMIRYAEGRRCRHAELAAHLGERLPPCGDACDVCTGESRASATTRAGREQPPRKRTAATTADALTALKALATAPFPLGKTGLTRLLEGSIQSRIQDDRSAYFGALADLQKSKIEATIDALVSGGALFHDRGGDFPLLRLTREGLAHLQAAERDETAELEAMLSRSGIRPRPAAPVTDETSDGELSSADDEILHRLRVWRRERSLQDSVPAYVVAPNASLEELAQRRPATLADLSQITGFGPARIEKYGSEILAVLTGAESAPEVD
jgi:ATP-dependent DNA helicase RecQ